ncbi:GUN4 domain-containing protein [Synechococcus sp. Nb3U1]|nr:GUN4 domain-containing protein [Synechococcus sp. Nb3U1]
MLDIDYRPLQTLLESGSWLEADRLTLQLLCRAAGEGAMRRGWLYFSEVSRIPVEDLRTIDQLWRVASSGRFGYSIQRQLWLGVNRKWERLWPLIGWKQGYHWTRYPDEFTWEPSAPKGHLPLSNQLRGARVLEELLTHKAWEDS